MKFIYIDESGSPGHTNVFTMCGVMVDAYRRPTMVAALDQELKSKLELWHQNYHNLPSELKTDSFINGAKNWSRVPSDERKRFLEKICQLTIEHGGTIFGIGFSFDSFDRAVNADLGQPMKTDYWLSGAMFIICLIQKKMQKKSRHKGKTVVNIDNNPRGLSHLASALRARNPWFDGLYQTSAKRYGKMKWIPRKLPERFNQIIDTPSAVESEYSSLIQIADAISYIYRRHLELTSLEEKKNWPEEKNYYDNLVATLNEARQTLGRCPDEPCVNFFKQAKHTGWKL